MKYLSEYLEYLKYQKNYSDETIHSYSIDIEEFLDYINSECIIICEVGYDVVKAWLIHLDEKKNKSTTVSRKISSLRSFYKYLARNNYIAYNPFSLTKGPKKDKLLPKFLYYNELEELFNACDLDNLYGIRDRLILEVLYATGMRVGELEFIKITDINFYDNSIKILGKGNKERIVYFGEYAREILDLYLSKRNDKCEYLFINNHCNRLTSRGVRYILNKIIDKTSLNTKISPHMIRHSFATHMLNEGCDLLTVQELLGHETLRATQVYTHVTNDRLKDVYLKAHPRNKERIEDNEI